MPKLPRPKDIAAAAPDVITIAAGTVLARVYFTAGPHPTAWNAFRHYGPTNARFDHHLPDAQGQACEQQRAVFYAATQAVTCMAEVFQQTRRIDRVRDAPWLVIFELRAALQLLDLTGAYPTRAGASMAINTGSRVRAREWARRFHEQHSTLHGLHYPSSMHANQPSLVLNERVLGLGALPLHPQFNRALADDAMVDVLKHAASRLGYGLR